jgi:hypothetical protein
MMLSRKQSTRFRWISRRLLYRTIVLGIRVMDFPALCECSFTPSRFECLGIAPSQPYCPTVLKSNSYRRPKRYRAGPSKIATSVHVRKFNLLVLHCLKRGFPSYVDAPRQVGSILNRDARDYDVSI